MGIENPDAILASITVVISPQPTAYCARGCVATRTSGQVAGSWDVSVPAFNYRDCQAHVQPLKASGNVEGVLDPTAPAGIVRVRTLDASGSLVDCDFSLLIFRPGLGTEPTPIL